MFDIRKRSRLVHTDWVFGLCAQVEQHGKFYGKVVSQVPHICTGMSQKIIGYVLGF